MKRWIALLLTGVLCLGLAGCGVPLPPAKTIDGRDWGEDWITVGGTVGVDAPGGMEHRENNEALAANGLYYATWSMGEGEPYTNADGKDATLYDAQVYLLLAGHAADEEATDTLNQWKDMAQLNYIVDATGEETHGGLDFTVMTYTFDSESNPYARGASAFGQYRNYAVSVELTCRQDFDGDAAQLLGQFLDNCYYAMP